jgi:GNAT superfamily N-acetyltransferase
MNIIHGYRDDKALRDSFNALAEQTFGLNFEGWYQNGFWKDNYDPHSIVIDGEVVSNVSVNRTDLMIGGRRYRILQLGTVMTAEHSRGKGYGRAIMEYIEKEYADVDGIYLFANDTVVDYYPRFGFRPAVEYAYRKKGNEASARFRVRFYQISIWLGSYFPIRLLLSILVAIFPNLFAGIVFEIMVIVLYLMCAMLLSLSFAGKRK